MSHKLLKVQGMLRQVVVDTSKVNLHRGRSQRTHLIAVLDFNNQKTQNWPIMPLKMESVVKSCAVGGLALHHYWGKR